MCMPNGTLFQVYDWTLFQQKVYEWPHFSGLGYERPTFLMYPGTCTYFSFRYFSRLLVLLVFNEMTAIFVSLPAINGYKISKGSI